MERQQVLLTYSVTPDHLVCLIKTHLCWHQQTQHTVNRSMNVKAVHSQPSCLTSSAVLMGRQHPPLFLHSERCRWDKAEGITAVLQGGSWLSKQVGFWLAHLPLWGGRLLSVLSSSDSSYQYAMFHFISVVISFSSVILCVAVWEMDWGTDCICLWNYILLNAVL